MSKTFFWSDLHFGHSLVARLRGFDSSTEHDEWIAQCWSETVGPRDTVWVLGDHCLGNFGLKAAPILSQLPGTKHTVLGNHDAGHPALRGYLARQKLYREVFDYVGTAASIRHEGEQILLSHFPYAGDHEDTEDRFTQWRLPDEGRYLIHGHLHADRALEGRSLNVGVEIFSQGPVDIDRVWSIFKAGEPL